MDEPVSRGVARTTVRPYEPADRDAVRAICADTGFLGKPIDPVFEDRELFCDYLTAYYTDAEPESVFVCILDGEVKGYLMGSRFPDKKEAYEKRMLPGLVLRGLWRLITRPYNAASRRYVWWIITRGRQEVPFTPPKMPHLHLNVRPEARSVANAHILMDAYLSYLVRNGEKQVYGQVVAHETRRGKRLFTHFGFHVVDEREITKYRAFHPDKVYLYTIVKDLEANFSVYGNKKLKSEQA